MSYSILHISHTDICRDSRILKELDALSSVGDYHVKAVGYDLEENGRSRQYNHPFEINTLNLFSRKWRFLPRPLKYAFNILEMTLDFFYFGIKMRPRVVHCHDTMALFAGYLIKLTTGAKLIYDAHELESDKNGQTKLLSKATIFIEKFCWKKIDLLISVSPSINKWYEINIGPKENIVVLNSPVVRSSNSSKHDNKFSSNYLREKFNIAKDRKIFIYVGIIGSGRGIEQSLSAFSEKDMKDDIVFLGYGPLENDVIRYASTNNNVHFHEAVPHDQVVSLIQSADIGLCLIENVSLSDYYALPNKLFEYCFAGLPVLATNFPEIENIVTRYNLGICSKISSADISTTIKKFKEKERQIKMKDLTKLSWEYQSQKIVDVYSKLIKS